LVDRTWEIAGNRMKSGQPHRVPLSTRAVELLEGLAHWGGLVFPRGGDDPDLRLHHAEPVKTLRRMLCQQRIRAWRAANPSASARELKDAEKRIRVACNETVHGFRSSFRDWCGDCTSFPADVAEAALAHVVGDKTRRAYQRGDMFEQRRRLMEAWAEFCVSPPVEQDKVVLLRAAASAARA
jgi:integrase